MIHKFEDNIRFGLQLLNGWRMKHERWIADLRCIDLASHFDGGARLKVLDLANGQLRPQYKILRADGQLVYGIDMVNRPRHDWQGYVSTIARAIYARGLRRNNSVFDDTLVCGDVSLLPFRDESFDLVTSVAAFEHFLNVPAVLSETHRVLRPRGILWALVHLFSSPSGGHNVTLSQVPLRNIPSGIEPWDHLRKRRLRFHVPLNEWRLNQYLTEFCRSFQIIKHYCAMREGEHLLTPEIEQELSDYSRDDLTCVAYVIAARKHS
jgi:SAM-dependent methyltransferase